ncbi:MAG: tyrosine-type recombinase/integrase [Galbitalea sp.]
MRKRQARSRTLAIPSFAAEVIRGRLVLVAGEPDDHLLFFTKEGTPLSTYNVRRSLREIVADAGLAGREITPHTFRKTGATFISRGSDEESAAKFLGHGNSAITKEHYIEVDEDAIVDPMPAAILEKLGPQKRRVAAADCCLQRMKDLAMRDEMLLRNAVGPRPPELSRKSLWHDEHPSGDRNHHTLGVTQPSAVPLFDAGRRCARLRGAAPCLIRICDAWIMDPLISDRGCFRTRFRRLTHRRLCRDGCPWARDTQRPMYSNSQEVYMPSS